MKYTQFKQVALVGAGLFATAAAVTASAQPASDQRWYQIEVTLFAYDNAMQVQEHWPMEALQQPLPRNIRALDRLTDVLTLPAWQAVPEPASTVQSEALPVSSGSSLPNPASPDSALLSSTPAALMESAVPLRSTDFRLPDAERDAFLALPPTAHGFTDTNRALTGSPRYRVLYHDAWRQPLSGASQAVPIWISGGQQFDDRHELEGSLTVRFNPGQDRVVLDARLWLTQFSTLPPASGEGIRLPDLPLFLASNTNAPGETQQSGTAAQQSLSTAQQQIMPATQALPTSQAPRGAYPVQVIPVLSSREMRSNEFHYIDHPAVGIVIHVTPYSVPPLPVDAGALL